MMASRDADAVSRTGVVGLGCPHRWDETVRAAATPAAQTVILLCCGHSAVCWSVITSLLIGSGRSVVDTESGGERWCPGVRAGPGRVIPPRGRAMRSARHPE